MGHVKIAFLILGLGRYTFRPLKLFCGCSVMCMASLPILTLQILWMCPIQSFNFPFCCVTVGKKRWKWTCFPCNFFHLKEIKWAGHFLGLSFSLFSVSGYLANEAFLRSPGFCWKLSGFAFFSHQAWSSFSESESIWAFPGGPRSDMKLSIFSFPGCPGFGVKFFVCSFPVCLRFRLKLLFFLPFSTSSF